MIAHVSIAHVSKTLNIRLVKDRPAVRARLKGWRVEFLDLITRRTHFSPIYASRHRSIGMGPWEAFPKKDGTFRILIRRPDGACWRMSMDRTLRRGDSVCFAIPSS